MSYFAYFREGLHTRQIRERGVSELSKGGSKPRPSHNCLGMSSSLHRSIIRTGTQSVSPGPVPGCGLLFHMLLPLYFSKGGAVVRKA